MSAVHHCVALFALALCTLVASSRATEAPQAHWTIVDADGVAAAFGGGHLVQICPLEELRIRVNAEIDSTAMRSHILDGSAHARVSMEIVRVDDADRVVAVHNVELKIWDDHEHDAVPSLDEPPPAPPRTIECALDPAFCVPKIVGIRLSDVDRDAGHTLCVNHSIVLQFAAPTNRPDAATRQAIEQFVSFPIYVGDAFNGTWIDDSTLVIIVTALDETRVLPLQQLMEALVSTTVRIRDTSSPSAEENHVIRVQCDVRLRVEPLGDYTIRLPLGSETTFLMAPVVRVRRCGDPSLQSSPLVIILSEETQSTLSNAEIEPVLPEPSIFLDGVLSHSGTEALELHHSGIQIQEPGSWSLNFWLFTDQEATGSFRALFFNGDGTGQHRTPSAWFRPDDRRLVLRVSTAANMDVGMDSTREIPRNEWVNIGLTFKNCSTGIDANATRKSEWGGQETPTYLYEMLLFVNGVLDQHVRMSTPVLPSNGPLQLGKSPWTDGFRGFTSHVRVYGKQIRDTDHTAIYARERSLHRAYTTPKACEALANPTANAQASVHPVQQQISYWTQCVPFRHDSKDEQHALATQRLSEDTTASSLYDAATRLRSLCDSSAWDLLIEAAELEDPRALHDVGTAFVYGRLAFTEGDCVKSKLDGVPVEINHERAKDLLLKALRKHEWRAARALALIHTYNNTSVSHPLQAGLYHLAAASGRKDAFMTLGRVYKAERKDVAAYHYFHAASEASVAYHARGKQPLHEMDRLYDGMDKEDDLAKGQLGDDDALIQYQKMRADQDGDTDAMANMGDLYYWGARGIMRDHAQAYRYYHCAAQQGHTNAQSAVAGMLLKGEGTRQDNASAVAWYEKAARQNHTRALNGLGFLHFYGSGGMHENKTLALELFERAAANLEDGDSVFNAGYCHAFGLGTTRNLTRAIQYYDVAARRFGHFDAIHELGKIHWTGSEEEHGTSIPRDSARAISYLHAASEAGTWGASVRTGFEYFLAGQYERASVVYAEATEYGYPVATSNLAYVYDQNLLRLGDLASEQRALRHLQHASERTHDRETLVRIGDYHYYGLGGIQANAVEALRWYSRASAEGVDAGAYNVGHMHEHGLGGVSINYARAERYYRRVLELAPPEAIEKKVVVQLALVRLRMRRWLERMPIVRRLIQGQGSTALPNARLPLPGQQYGENDMRRSIVTVTSIALAIVVASVGVWLVRRRR